MVKRLFNSIGNEDAWKKINRFVQYNTYVFTAGLIFSFFYFNYKIGSLTDTVEETLVKNTIYIKKNIGHPIFLSATGQILTVKKSPMSYYDDRFKQYIVNNVADNLIGGLVKISNNFTVDYSNHDNLIKKYSRFNQFVEYFTNKDPQVIRPYANALYLSIIENRLPEYIDVIGAKLVNYTVKEDSKNEGVVLFKGDISLETVVKSWMAETAKWDTRSFTINIAFEMEANPVKYANVGNPFGLNFTKIESPVLLKPENSSKNRSKR